MVEMLYPLYEFGIAQYGLKERRHEKCMRLSASTPNWCDTMQEKDVFCMNCFTKARSPCSRCIVTSCDIAHMHVAHIHYFQEEISAKNHNGIYSETFR